MTADDPRRAASGARLRWLRPLLAIALAAGALVLLGRGGARAVPAFIAGVHGLGGWGAAVFVLGYAAAAVAFVPGSVLTLAAGALFGLARGVALAFAGALLGSTAAFLVARYAARPWVERRLAADARFRRIDRAVGGEGLRLVILLRLSPLLPFNLMNYALGVTGVRLRDYVIGGLGMLPGTILYVWAGKLAGDVAAAAGGARVGRGAAYWAVATLGFAATVAATVLVTRAARRALDQTDTGEADAR